MRRNIGSSGLGRTCDRTHFRFRHQRAHRFLFELGQPIRCENLHKICAHAELSSRSFGKFHFSIAVDAERSLRATRNAESPAGGDDVWSLEMTRVYRISEVQVDVI